MTFLSKDEIIRLYRDANLQEKMALTIGLNTGISLSEMLKIRKEDVNFEENRISIGGRYVYLPYEAMQTLRQSLMVLNGGTINLFNYIDDTWDKNIKEIWSRRVGREIRWKDIRSNYAEMAARAGCPIKLVARNMGVSEQQIDNHFRLDDVKIREILKDKVFA